MKKLVKAAKFGRSFDDWIGKTVRTRDGKIITIEDCSYSSGGGVQGWYDNDTHSILLMDDNDKMQVEFVDGESPVEGATIYDYVNDPNSDYRQTINNMKETFDMILQDLDQIAANANHSKNLEDNMWTIIDKLDKDLNSASNRCARTISR